MKPNPPRKLCRRAGIVSIALWTLPCSADANFPFLLEGKIEDLPLTRLVRMGGHACRLILCSPFRKLFDPVVFPGQIKEFGQTLRAFSSISKRWQDRNVPCFKGLASQKNFGGQLRRLLHQSFCTWVSYARRRKLSLSPAAYARRLRPVYLHRGFSVVFDLSRISCTTRPFPSSPMLIPDTEKGSFPYCFQSS